MPVARAGGRSTRASIGLAMVPVLFAYSGWQTSSFMTAELHEPQTTLPRGLLTGVVLVVLLYLAVNATCLHVLGIGGLAATNTPASQVAQNRVRTDRLDASWPLVIALSTLGFLSNQILTSPRVYFQMAADGTFFKQLAWVNPRTHVPVLAIVLQGRSQSSSRSPAATIRFSTTLPATITSSSGLAAIALIVFRNRDARDPAAPKPAFRMPGHPVTTLIFLAAAWYVVGDTVLKSPADTGIGIGILLSGLPVYLLFTRRRATWAE